MGWDIGLQKYNNFYLLRLHVEDPSPSRVLSLPGVDLSPASQRQVARPVGRPCSGTFSVLSLSDNLYLSVDNIPKRRVLCDSMGQFVEIVLLAPREPPLRRYKRASDSS